MEALQKANTSLEEANVQYKDKEDELSALGRRIMLLETESNGADVKLAKTTMELALDSKRADKVLKVVNALNSKAMNTEVEIEELCKSEKEAKFMASESEKKYDEISRRLGVVQEELKMADARAEYGEMNITKLNQRIDNIEDDIIRAK